METELGQSRHSSRWLREAAASCPWASTVSLQRMLLAPGPECPWSRLVGPFAEFTCSSPVLDSFMASAFPAPFS